MDKELTKVEKMSFTEVQKIHPDRQAVNELIKMSKNNKESFEIRCSFPLIFFLFIWYVILINWSFYMTHKFVNPFF